MKNWILRRVYADYAGLSRELNIDPVAVRIMVNRGITDIEEMKKFLSDDISDSFTYKGLPNIQKSIEKIKEARDRNLKCLIVGDYDADGVCATTILMKGLSLFGLDCDYVIPNRLLDGYGINENIVEKAKDEGFGFIITCDNGISAKNAIDKAVDYGIEVVVTDHHTVTESEVPTKTGLIVNPKLNNNEYSFAEICGAQVAFKVLCALFEGQDSFESIKEELLEYAAIACVTDVMPLTDENRSLVKWVLKRLKNPLNKGLLSLSQKLEISSKDKACVASDISFRIGPCINAAGRIEVADYGVNLFLSDDSKKIDEISSKLIELNNDRKVITDKNVNDGIDLIDSLYKDKELPDVLVIYMPECHVAICGLVAGKIKEKFYRPTIVLTDSPEGLTGSGRSIDEYDLIENIQKCAGILKKFGGHKAACGLSLEKEKLDELRDKLNYETGLSSEDLTEKIYIDADMPFGYVTEKVLNDIYRLEPFGQKNRSPVFAQKELLLVKGVKKGIHLFITVKDNKGMIRELKLWRKADEFEEFLVSKYGAGILKSFYDYSNTLIPEYDIRISVIYNPVFNTYMNNTSIDFVINDYKYS